MRKTVWLLLLLAAVSCTQQSRKELLVRRWNFKAVNMPNEGAFIDSIRDNSDEALDAMQHYFLDYKLVLRKDNTFDLVLFKKYLHGTWGYDEKYRVLFLNGAASHLSSISLQVDSLTIGTLEIRMDSNALNRLIPSYAKDVEGMQFFNQKGPFKFLLYPDIETYHNEKDDPYSQQNNLWRIKPAHSETGKEVLARVENHVQFCRLIMQDAVDREKDYISFHSIRSPLIVSKDEISLKRYSTVRDAWDESFYDSTQAMQGYKMLQQAVGKPFKRGTEDSRFKNNVTLLNQVLANLEGDH